MTDRIAAGDLVIVAKVDHQCAEVLLGRVYIFRPGPAEHPGIFCPICCTRDVARRGELIHSYGKGPAHRPDGFPARWLKRIPPLDELECVRTEEKLKEPA